MATTETKKKIDESAFLIVRDKTNDNVQLIACPANFQVGLTSTPADLTLNGKFSISEKAYSVSESNKWTAVIDDHITAALVSTIYSSTSTPSSGYVSVILPKSARDGQIVIIKDFSGTSTTLPIRIYSAGGEKIDGSDYSTISTNYSVTQFIRYEKKWVTTSNTNPAGAPTNASYVVLSTDSTLTSERVLTAGSGVSIVDGGPGGSLTISVTGGGSGDVLGPASATDNAVVRFDLTTGKLIQDSGVIISDSNDVTVPGDIAVNGGDITTTASTFNLINTTATTLNIGAGATTALNIGATAGTVAAAGSLTVGGGYGSSGVSISSTGNIQANGTLTVDSTSNLTGNVTCSGDLAVNGTTSADITTTTTTATLFNANATTLDIGGAATTIQVGASTGTTTVNNRLHATGGTSLLLDAELGNAAVGSHPAFESSFPTVYALFGHKDLNHAVDGNYALVQSNAGDTFVGASSTRDIYFKNGTDAVGQLSNDTVSFTGKSSTATTTTIGNTTGASTTTINAGTGGIDIDHVGAATINIGTNNETRTTNISTGAAYQTVTVGSNYGGSTLALRGGSFSVGGQIDVETGTGGGGNGGDINIGATSYARDINIGTGGNSTAQGITIGSTYLGSDVKIYAGQAGVINIGSNSATGRTINIATGQTDGNTNIGTSTGTGTLSLHTGTGDITIGTSDYTRTIKIGSDTSCSTRQTVNVAPLNTGNYNIVKICDGASNTGHEVRIISENSSQSGGYALVKIGTIANTCQTTIGNNSSNSFTKIYGGANGVTIDVQAGSSINVGGTDAVAQSVTIGNTTGASATTIDAGTGNIDIGSSNSVRTINIGSTSTAANTIKLLPGTTSALGTVEIAQKSTFYNKVRICDDVASTGHEVYINTGNDSAIASPITTPGNYSVTKIGTLNAESRVTLGSTNTTSITTIQAGTNGLALTTGASGTGNISIGNSTETYSIDIGLQGANTGGEAQTINVGHYSASGGTKNVNIRGDIIKLADTGGYVQLCGGYGSTGVTVSAAGNIETNGTLTVDSTSILTGNVTFGGNIVADANENKSIFTTVTSNTITIGGSSSTLAATGALTVGGGYGSAGVSISANGVIEADGNLTVDGTSINIGTTAVIRTVNIGTGAAVQTINLGTSADANIISLGSNAAQSIGINGGAALNLLTNAGTTTIDSGGLSSTGIINIGIFGYAQTISIGNTTGATSVALRAGSGGITFETAATASSNLAVTGDLAVNGGDITTTSATFNLVNAATTINLGSTTVTRTINIGTNATNVQTINVGTGNAANSITIGSNAASIVTVSGGDALNLYADAGAITMDSGGSGGTGTINIGTFGYAQTVSIGNTTGATSLALRAGSGGITFETATTASSNLTVTGDLAVNGGDITTTSATFNLVNAATTINLGSTAVNRSINVGTAGANTIVIGNFVAGSATTVSGVTMNMYSSGGTIAIDSAGNGGVVNIDTFGYNSTVNVGTGAAVKTVTVGSTNTTSTTTIQAGSGGITLTGNATLSGDIAVNGGDITTTSATFNLVNAATTINLGSTAVTRAINIGTNATNVQTINVGTGNAANAISIGSNAASSVGINGGDALNLYADAGTITMDSGGSGGTGVINVGTFGYAQTITLGNTTGATSLLLQAGTGNITLSGGNSTTYAIGTSSTTGTITVGQSTDTNTINIGNGATASTKTQTINVGNSTASGGITNINIGAASNGTNTITIGKYGSGLVNVVLGGDDVQIGDNASSDIGFFGTTPQPKTTVTDITNNVTAGGTANTLSNYTSLTTYSTDAAAIRNNFYQIGVKLNAIIDALQSYGLI